MTNRHLVLLLVPVLFFVAVPAQAASTSPLTFSVKNVTIVKAPPTCEVRSTKRRMTSGAATKIIWESKNATSMTGLTLDETVWPPEGRQRVAIAFVGKHEFPMTFEGPGGRTTCVAKVFVHPKRAR